MRPYRFSGWRFAFAAALAVAAPVGLQAAGENTGGGVSASTQPQPQAQPQAQPQPKTDVALSEAPAKKTGREADETAAAKTSPSTAVEPKLALGEQRLSVQQVAAMRKTAMEKGDKVKELCLYDRLRGLQQTLESTQVAVAALEAALARNDAASEKSERERLQRTLDLSRQFRTDAEACVGGERITGAQPTKLAVSGGKTDDSKAGPSELQTIRPVRLELPSRPNPASAFRPSR